MNRDESEHIQHLQLRLLDAELKWRWALHRLMLLERAALAGEYDDAAFDQAVLAYRQAAANVHDARAACALAYAAPLPDPGGPAIDPHLQEPPDPAPAASPRMQFVRWLVQTGRLSDWDVGVPATDAASHREDRRASAPR